jgi:hypothetical protein
MTTSRAASCVSSGTRHHEGVGVIEAPRGTLIHHYRVDDDDLVTMCNLIVSTTHNNQPMNEAVRRVAQRYLNGQRTDRRACSTTSRWRSAVSIPACRAPRTRWAGCLCSSSCRMPKGG